MPVKCGRRRRGCGRRQEGRAGHRSGRCAATLLAGALAATTAPSSGHAHPEFLPEGTGCYLTAIVAAAEGGGGGGGGELQLAVAVLFGPAAGQQERRRADRDGNGRIDPAELAAAGAAWLATGARLFRIWLDGQRFSPSFANAIDLRDSFEVRPAPLGVRFEARFALSEGPHRLRIEPDLEPPTLVETEIAIDLDETWHLEQSFRAGGAGIQRGLFRMAGPRRAASEDRSVTFVFSPAAAEPARPSRWRGLPLVLFLAALAFAGLAVCLIPIGLARTSRLGRALRLAGLLLAVLAVVAIGCRLVWFS